MLCFLVFFNGIRHPHTPNRIKRSAFIIFLTSLTTLSWGKIRSHKMLIVLKGTSSDYYYIHLSWGKIKSLNIRMVRKGIISSYNTFLRFKAEDINKNSLFPKFQLIPILHFQVLHDYVMLPPPGRLRHGSHVLACRPNLTNQSWLQLSKYKWRQQG